MKRLKKTRLCVKRHFITPQLTKMAFLSSTSYIHRSKRYGLHEVYTIKIWWKPVQFPWFRPDFNEVSGNVMEILCKLDKFQS
ncbi:unnamed protein product [Rhizophagus irregularis]|nr:unnamed protein product [Rhizophagus irregularis]